MKRAALLILLALPALPSRAQRTDTGWRLSVEAGGGALFAPGVPFASYGIALGGAYRFPGRLAIGGGLRGEGVPRSSATAATLFLRASWDILEGRISPYLGVETGFSFQLPLVHNRICEPGDEKYRILDENAERYVPVSETQFMANVHSSDVLHFNGTYDIRRTYDKVWSRYHYEAVSGALDLRYRYLFSRHGPYAQLGAGVSLPAGSHRMRIGLQGGIGRCFRGIWARSDANELLALDTIVIQQRYERDPDPYPGSGTLWKSDREGDPIVVSTPVWVGRDRKLWCPYMEIAWAFEF